jgi:hypothetical protein
MLFRQPVIITLYDVLTENVYWQAVQEYVDTLLPRDRRKIKSIVFRNDKLLNLDSINQIEDIVIQRYELFDSGEAGARLLEEALLEQYGLKIEYDPHGMIIMPEGKFIASGSRAKKLILFGDTLRQIDSLQKKLEGRTIENIVETALESTLKILEAFREGGKLQVRDASGVVLQEFSNEAELFEHIASTRVPDIA